MGFTFLSVCALFSLFITSMRSLIVIISLAIQFSLMIRMKKIKCGILHPDGEVCERFSNFIGQTPFLSLSAKYTSQAEMLFVCQKKEIELLFCGIDKDIEKVASFCASIDSSILVIFISSDKNRAFDCFRLNALDFLLATDSYSVFLTSANKALQRLSLQASDTESGHIYVKSGYRIVRLEFEHIDYIESCDEYVKIHCDNQSKPILSLCSLKKMESVLPANDFIRVHRSYIVRKKSITVLENRSIIFSKTRIPVSKSCLKGLQEYIQICQ